jgi:hypothetical protein
MASTTLSPVPSYDIPNQADERSRTLYALLQQGHGEVALLLGPKLLFHSHVPHVRQCIFVMVSSANQLEIGVRLLSWCLCRPDEGDV